MPHFVVVAMTVSSCPFAPGGSVAPGVLPAFCAVPLIPSAFRWNPHGGARSTTTAGAPRRPPAWLNQPLVPSPVTSRNNHRGLLRCSASPSSAAAASSLPSARQDNAFPAAKNSGGGRQEDARMQRSGNSFGTLFSGAGGAEWAGWECRFSGADGTRVAVPEDYVPESLREWDVEVWGFETLTSEQRRQDQDESGGHTAGLVYRKIGRVYPEAGCGLDNLSLEVNAQSSPLKGEGVFFGAFEGGSYVLGKRAEGSRVAQGEAGLLVPGRPFGEAVVAEDSNDESSTEESRIRLEFRVEGAGGEGGQGEPGGKLGTTVVVTRERKYREGFDDGLLYKGGGLDSQKLRRLLRSKCFGEEEVAPTAAELAGEWRCGPGAWSDLKAPVGGEATSPSSPDTTPSEAVLSTRPATHWENSSDITSLLLRGGVTIRAGSWRSDADSDAMWGAAAASLVPSPASGSCFDDGVAFFAVEVGWLVGPGDELRREVLTTVFELASMAPVGAWKGAEVLLNA